jgi:DNA polymerase III subunit delta
MSANSPERESIEPEKLLPCYLYTGAAESLLEDTIDKLKGTLKEKINFDTDFKVFSGTEEINEEEFTGYISTPSLFSSKKIAVIKHIEKLPAALQRKIVELVSISSGDKINIVFILTSSKKKINPALLDAIKKFGKITQLKPLSGGSLRKWLDGKSSSDGIKFTEDAAALLIDNVNLDISLLRMQYEKLFNYISSEEKKVIDENTVKFLVNRAYSLKIFDLVDYIGQKDRDNSLRALKAILEEEQNLIGLITLLHRMFKCFLYIKSENSRSRVTGYIENNIRVSPYFIGKMVNKYIKLSSNFKEPEILKIFKVLNSYDINFRTGTLETKNLVSKLICEITDITTF